MQSQIIFKDRTRLPKDILEFCRETPRSLEELTIFFNLAKASVEKYTGELLTNDSLKVQRIKIEEGVDERYFSTDRRGERVTRELCRFKQRDNLVYNICCDICNYHEKCIAYNEFFKPSSQRP